MGQSIGRSSELDNPFKLVSLNESCGPIDLSGLTVGRTRGDNLVEPINRSRLNQANKMSWSRQASWVVGLIE